MTRSPYDFDVVAGEATPAKCTLDRMRDEQNKGTEGRVYGGNPNLLHVPDGTRANLGHLLAAFLEGQMRTNAENRTEREKETQLLCPGCYMVVGFDMMIVLADENGQSRKELARCMMNAFKRLYDNPDGGLTEEITVLLDPED